MTNRERFLAALSRRHPNDRPVFGTGTSIVCQDLMERVGTSFPEGHTDAEKMAALAMAGYTELGFDVVMPLFSVCHEAAAMGCNVDWGSPDRMPESGPPLFKRSSDIRIPDDLLTRSACQVPLEAIRLLKNRLGDDAAVCGKVFGPWTQGYHLFGVESFLMGTLDDPDDTRRILERLMPVTIQFAKAQIEAGADCLLLADHATRDLCSPKAYAEFLKDVHSQLAEAIPCPLILHICGNTGDRIGMIAETGLDCFHWDTKIGTAEYARSLAGDKLSLMGGISNLKLLQATREQIRTDAELAHAAGIDIIGPECAIPLTTPLENLKAVRGV
jgi:MtaA/CmuA family methyltransferase